MPRRIIDISVALQGEIASDQPGMEPKIKYYDHRRTAKEVCGFFPGPDARSASLAFMRLIRR